MSARDSTGHNPPSHVLVFGQGQPQPVAHGTRWQDSDSDVILRVLACPAAELAPQAYIDAYQQLSPGWPAPMEVLAVSAERLAEHRAVLFLTRGAADQDTSPPAMRLYVRGEPVQAAAGELLPEWLSWVHGAVGLPCLPATPAREGTPRSRHLRLVRRALTRAVLSWLEALLKGDRPRYESLWRDVGATVQRGLLRNDTIRETLAGVLLFGSSRDAAALTTLREYVARMPDDQQDIWYAAGANRDEIEASAALGAFRARGWEVLYLTGPVDDQVLEALSRFAGIPVRDAGGFAVPVAVADDGHPAQKLFLGDLPLAAEGAAPVQQAA